MVTMENHELAAPVDLEKLIYDFLDVLARTRETNILAMTMIEHPDTKALLERDNELLTELRARIWKQFAPVVVDVVN